MEPITDREVMMKLDGSVSSLREAIERFAKALENIETVKIKDLEVRVNQMEKKWDEFGGAYKFIGVIALVLGSASIVLDIAVILMRK